MGLGADRHVQEEPDWRAWARLGAGELLPRLVNDLEPAAFSLSPRLAEMRRQCEACVGRPVRMSGSGSSLFTLYDAAEQSEALAAREQYGRTWNVDTRLVELAPDVDDGLARSVESRGCFRGTSSALYGSSGAGRTRPASVAAKRAGATRVGTGLTRDPQQRGRPAVVK
jgi:hypothetical protein